MIPPGDCLDCGKPCYSKPQNTKDRRAEKIQDLLDRQWAEHWWESRRFERESQITSVVGWLFLAAWLAYVVFRSVGC